MDYEPLICLMPERCAPARACIWERTRLRREEDLGRVHPPPCFLSLLTSLYEVETVRQALADAGWSPDETRPW